MKVLGCRLSALPRTEKKEISDDYEKNQLKWFRHLTRMPSLECFSGQVQLGEGLAVDPELGEGDKISHLGFSRRSWKVLLWRNMSGTLCTCCHSIPDKWRKMDGQMELRKSICEQVSLGLSIIQACFLVFRNLIGDKFTVKGGLHLL